MPRRAQPSASAAGSTVRTTGSVRPGRIDAVGLMPGAATGRRRGREFEHLARGTVTERQLVVLDGSRLGQVHADLPPVGIGPRSRGLGEVAQHGDRSRRGAPGDHAELHGRQVLGLVDDDMSVRAGAAAGQERGLVQQGEVVGTPCRRGCAELPGAQKQLPFRLGQEPGGVALELGTRGQELTHERGGGDRRPQCVEEGGELVARRELAFEPGFVGAQACRRTEDAPRLADEPGP